MKYLEVFKREMKQSFMSKEKILSLPQFTIREFRPDQMSDEIRTGIKNLVLYNSLRETRFSLKHAMAYAAYFLVDLYHPIEQPNSYWHILQVNNKARGVVMLHKGHKYLRRFFACSPDDTRIYLANSTSIQRQLVEQLPGITSSLLEDIPIVVNKRHFAPEDLPQLLGSRWRLRGNSAIEVNRMALDEKSFRKKNLRLQPLPSGFTHRPLTKDDLSKIYQLLEFHKHHTFKQAWLDEGMHYGIFSPREELVSMIGFSGMIKLPGLRAVTNSTGTVTAQEWEGHGFASFLRIAHLRELFSNKRLKSCVVAGEITNNKIYRFALNLGYEPTADFYWAVYDPKNGK